LNKSGIGVGSASIILVFAVLCLTIFSLITYVVAGNDKALVDAKHNLVTGYYFADYQAELILENIITAEEIPESVGDVIIHKGFDEISGIETVFFSTPISETKALFVNVFLSGDGAEILSWRMYNTDEWIYDGSLNVWTGDED